MLVKTKTETFSTMCCILKQKLIKDANKHKIWAGWESDKVTQYELVNIL